MIRAAVGLKQMAVAAGYELAGFALAMRAVVDHAEAPSFGGGGGFR